MEWPDRNRSEKWQISQVIEWLPQLSRWKHLEIIEKREKPDYLLRDRDTGEFIGVELTAVYISDDSVPKDHMKDGDFYIPYNLHRINKYKQRFLECCESKILKARHGYEIIDNLILAIYVNEYDSIHIPVEEWDELVRNNKHVFDNMNPFTGFLLYPLPGAMIVKPDRVNTLNE